jgi:ABC-2 type transport system ATP-binding protein
MLNISADIAAQNDFKCKGLYQEHAIRAHHLRKIFRKRAAQSRLFRPSYTELPAVNDITFHVAKGEIYGILGENGSGKSTLIRIISTLLIPDAGSVTIFGLDVQKHSAQVKRLLNRVSVDAAFYKKLSARENLLYSARLYGLDPSAAAARAQEILEKLGMRRCTFNQPLEEMSRSMQQKIAIARAFLASPIVVLLDEPTTGLDPRSKRDVHALILELRDKHGATIILTTHDMAEAERLCDRIAFIHRGELVAEGSLADLRRGAGGNETLEDAFIKLSCAPSGAEH